MANLVEKELSYKIVGALFNVYNSLGGGYQEKYYQRAIAKELSNQRIGFKEQVYIPLYYGKENIGRYFLDFVINEKIVLEIKAGSKFYIKDIKQILAYLKANNIQLGILANFSRQGLQLKRILKGSSK